jgi:hypothetical protein
VSTISSEGVTPPSSLLRAHVPLPLGSLLLRHSEHDRPGRNQACGFTYVGVMRAGSRALVRVNGKTMSERQAGLLTGTQGASALRRLGFDAVSASRRARYFAFRGDRREQARHRAAIANLIKPYPKRNHPAIVAAPSRPRSLPIHPPMPNSPPSSRGRAARTWARKGAAPPALCDRPHADTLLVLDGAPPRAAVVMAYRTELLFALLIDRLRWLNRPELGGPRGVFRYVTSVGQKEASTF